jgi:hypothetical protein
MNKIDIDNLHYVLGLPIEEREQFLLEKSTEDLMYTLELLIKYKIGSMKATFAEPEEIQKEIDKLKTI